MALRVAMARTDARLARLPRQYLRK